jgi:single-strand DNA-binding protein
MGAVAEFTLVGRLGVDPEVKPSRNGNQYAKLAIAVNRYDFQKKENIADWHHVVLFGDRAEKIAEYMRKGDTVFVRGRINVRGKDEDYRKDFIALHVVSVAKANGGGGSRGGESDGQYDAPGGSQPPFDDRSTGTPEPARDNPRPQPEDDLPF